MKVSVGPIDALLPHQLARWASIQDSVPFLDSPFFAPEYVRAVARCKEGVEVAMLEDPSGKVGFFPFERGRGRIGHPVGGDFSDFQAVIVEPGAELDPRALVRASDLSGWRFDHLLADQEPARAFHWAVAPSPYVDLSSGFEAYRSERKKSGTNEIEKTLYYARKAERRTGALRLDLHTRDKRVLAQLLLWKGNSCAPPDSPIVSRFPGYRECWRASSTCRPRRSLDSCRRCTWATSWPPCTSGCDPGRRFTTGSRPTTRTCRSSRPASFASWRSPRSVSGLGVRRIDLGKGPEPYKLRLMSGSIPVAEGAVHLSAGVGAAWRARYRTVEWARRSALRGLLLAPARWVRRSMAGGG